MSKSFSDMVIERTKEAINLDSIAKILESPCFVLTGSRFFGYATPNSDWDYFINETNFEKFAFGPRLINLGFLIKCHSRMSQNDVEYNDPSISLILEYKDLVHVQVIRSEYWNAKANAQDVLKLMCDTLGYSVLGCHTKFERRDLWQGMINRFYYLGS